MGIEIGQNKTKNQSPLKSKGRFFFIVFVVIIPIVVITLFVSGLIITNTPVGFTGWIVTMAVILLVWIGWFLFIKKVNHSLNDPEQSRLMSEQIELLSYFDKKTFKMRLGTKKHFQAPAGRVLSIASRMSVIAVALLGMLIYIALHTWNFSPESQQNIILIGGYIVIIGFIVLLVRAQKGSK